MRDCKKTRLMEWEISRTWFLIPSNWQGMRWVKLHGKLGEFSKILIRSLTNNVGESFRRSFGPIDDQLAGQTDRLAERSAVDGLQERMATVGAPGQTVGGTTGRQGQGHLSGLFRIVVGGRHLGIRRKTLIHENVSEKSFLSGIRDNRK